MKITFIIPIHNQLHSLRRCVESIWLRTPPTDFSIVFVDDGPTDPEIGAFCQLVRKCASWHNITHLYNDIPQGFSKACNQGMRVDSDCSHYAIVNPGTEIGTPDWAQSLCQLHDGDNNPDIGLFGPVSNNAGSQSVPTHLGGALPRGETIPSFAKLVATVTERRPPPATLIHESFYIVRKDVIKDVGNFDEGTFPHHGAVDDLSVRAAHVGWQGVVLDDVFVYHGGGARSTLAESALQILVGKYGEGYIATLRQRGSVGLEYMRVAMAEHYGRMYGMPRRVQ